MKPFSSVDHMVSVHAAMFGEAGARCAEFVAEWAPRLFDEPLDPLHIRIVLAPVEIGPYNNHAGYTVSHATTYKFILGNRHVCRFCQDGSFELNDPEFARDFLIHELTHHRQRILLDRHQGEAGWKQDRARGSHRDLGWYAAIAEAAPRYLGVSFPVEVWPKQVSVRRGKTVQKVQVETRLTEVEATHWPDAWRPLIAANDLRLPAVEHRHLCYAAGS